MEFLKSFLDYITYEKRFSEHTVQGYHTDLEQFFLFILETFEINKLEHVSRQVVRSWIIKLMQSNQAPTTVRRKISSLQSFYKFLIKKQIVDSNPVRGVLLPKLSTKVPSFLRFSEINPLISSSPDAERHPQYMDILAQTIFAILYHCGLRRAELIQLKLVDVNTRKREMLVFGKGSKQRIVPLSDELISLLEVYLTFRSDLNEIKDPEYLLLTEKGKVLYPNFVYRVVRNGIKLNSTSEKASPHVLRHTFASHLSQNGADLNAIKSLLGHSSLASTQVYTHHSLEGLKKVYEASHPRSKNST